MLNPGAASPTHTEMFVFLGKLMGMCVRTKEYLALNLPPFVWKKLVGQEVTLDDLEGMDIMLTKSLDDIRSIDRKGVTSETFELVLSETFSTMSSDNREIELIPKGSHKAVTFENRHEYCDLIEQYRLHEIDSQAAAVRKGLNMILPYRLLSLFSWNDLEIMICGVPEFDVNLLRSVTEYSGLRDNSQNVRYFWEALQEFSNEERSMFLRFTWGRSRLPLSADSFPQRFKLQQFDRSPADNYLPVSHTCFFSLELPNYSTVDIMKNKLRYAIFNCTSIDADGGGAGGTGLNEF
jgi:E3 ubiquitin-protein ligase HERC2